MLLHCCVIHLSCGELLPYLLQGLICCLRTITAGLRAPFSFLLSGIYYFFMYLISLALGLWSAILHIFVLKIKEFHFGHTNIFFICQAFYKVAFTCLSHHIISYCYQCSGGIFYSHPIFWLYSEDRGRRFVQNVGNFLCETGFEVSCNVNF
jgi:hypothetical protein